MVTYTFSIEISAGSEINEDLHDGVGISLGTPVGGLKVFEWCPITGSKTLSDTYCSPAPSCRTILGAFS